MDDLAAEIAPDGTRHAEPSNQQGAQTNQRQVDLQAVKETVDPRRRLLPGAKAPPGFGEGRLQFRFDATRIAAVRQAQPVRVGCKRSGLQKSCCGKPLAADHDTGAEGESADGAVGFGGEDAPDGEEIFADFQVVSNPQCQALQQGFFDDGAVIVVRFLQGALQGARGGQLQLSVQWIITVDGLEFHQRAFLAIRRGCHRPHADDLRDLSPVAHEIRLLLCQRAVNETDLQVAAEKSAGIVEQGGANRGGERADAADGENPKEQAGEKDAEAAQAAAQFPAHKAQDRGNERVAHAALPAFIRRPSSMRMVRWQREVRDRS